MPLIFFKMGKILISLFVLGLTLSCSSKSNLFAEFLIEDVSVEHQFLDSESAMSGRIYFMNHENMRYSIEGKLDSSGLIQFISYPKKNIVKEINLEKGSVSMINLLTDYYGGDTLLIKFIPNGCKKGYLKVSTNIN